MSTETKKRKTRKRKKDALAVFSIVVWIIGVILMIMLAFFIAAANVLPMKYFIIIVLILVILLGIHGLLVLKKNTRRWVLIVLNIMALFLMISEAFAITKIGDMLAFLKANIGVHFETNVYNIIVNKNAKYDSLESIQNETVKTVHDLEDDALYENKINEKVHVNIEYEDSVVDLLTKVKEETNMIIIVNSGNYEAMISIDEDYESKVRVIDTITIQTEVEEIDTGLKVTKDPFVVYLNGIDTRSSYLPARSLSDVNIILAINPVTKRILMIHIPRDYYVPIHGYNGARDKLTHSGTLGGIELSMATVEDLLEIQIPYYVRVNFNAVVKLVDAIGGINIHSDVNYSFSCWTDRGCVFNPGINYVGGRCALAFARERHAYNSGDRHRGENQEQVLQKVIEKVTSSSTLIMNYNNILNALNGTFETNFSMDEITSLVKMQIDDMASWQMETLNVDGTGSMSPTLSYPNLNLYVMNPNMETVTTAVQKLNEVLETE